MGLCIEITTHEACRDFMNDGVKTHTIIVESNARDTTF